MNFFVFPIFMFVMVSIWPAAAQDSLRFEKLNLNDTSYLIRKYDINNKIHAEEKYVSNVKESAIWYKADGTIYYENYYSGTENRITRTVFYSKNKISLESIYKNDSLRLIIEYHSNGKVAGTGLEMCTYKDLGLEESRCGLIGIWRYYYPSGKMQLIGAYIPEYDVKNNVEMMEGRSIVATVEIPKRHGVWIEFDENDQILKYTCYEFGVEVDCN